MKKLKIVALLLVLCVVLTGCGCQKKAKTYNVIFDSNGGSVVSNQIIENGKTILIPTNPKRDGYVFDGWYLEDGTKYDFSQKVTGDIKLIARWSKSGEKTCTLTCETGYELVDCECKKIETTTKEEKPSSEVNQGGNGTTTVGVSSVSLSESSLTLVVGDNKVVTATVNPSNATNKNITWTTSNGNVVTVSNGTITAVGAGSATVTATAGGKSATVTVTVITVDQNNLNNALATITPKTLTKGNTSISYSYSGCTITNTANVANAGSIVSLENVDVLYRPASGDKITSTYTVTCGNESANKTVEHVVEASTYKYTATTNNVVYIIKVAGATDYVLDGYMKYRSSIDGVQTGISNHSAGKVYDMTFNNDNTTIYAVTE